MILLLADGAEAEEMCWFPADPRALMAFRGSFAFLGGFITWPPVCQKLHMDFRTRPFHDAHPTRWLGGSQFIFVAPETRIWPSVGLPRGGEEQISLPP